MEYKIRYKIAEIKGKTLKSRANALKFRIQNTDTRIGRINMDFL
jgi:hypothetical protein